MPISTNMVQADRYLSNLACGFLSDGSMAAAQICKTVLVDKESGKFPIYTAADLMRLQMRVRGPGTEADDMIFSQTPGSYQCRNLSGKVPVPLEALSNDDTGALDGFVAKFVADQAAYAIANLAISAVMQASVWTARGADQIGTAATTSATQFVQFQVSGSTPYATINLHKTAVKKATRRKANRVIITEDVASCLREHADSKAKLNYAEVGAVSNDHLQKFIFPDGDGKLIVLDDSYNSAAMGATAVNAFLGGDAKMWVGYVDENPNPNALNPSALYTFAWDYYGLGTDAQGMYVLPPTVESGSGSKHRKVYEGGIYADCRVACPSCGVYSTVVVA